MNTCRREFLKGAAGLGMAGAVSACRSLTADGFDNNLAVFLSDVHICGTAVEGNPYYFYRYTWNELDRRIDEILAMSPKPRNVVIFGDLAFNHGEIEDYQAAAPKLKRLTDAGIKLTHAMGNHDRRNTFYEVFPECRESSPVPGRIVSIVDLGSAQLIMLDSLKAKDGEFKEGSGGPVDGRIDGGQREWFESYLPKVTKPTFVASHHNLCELVEDRGWLMKAMRNCPYAIGYIHGHGHDWVKDYSVGWGCENQDILRVLQLPSAGLWGCIGSVEFRTGLTSATAILHQNDYWFNFPLRPGEKKPETWLDIMEENRGATCRFAYERIQRKWKL